MDGRRQRFIPHSKLRNFTMDWLHPTFAWAGLAVVGMGWLFWRARRMRQAALDRFGEAALVRQLVPALRPWRRTLKAGLVVGAAGAVVLSLMGPRFGTKLRTVEQRGVDLVVAMDVSASMRSKDVAPSRLQRAKNEIRNAVGALSGDRVGLVLFAGTGFIQSPLTTDYGAFRLFLDVAAPDQVPTPGTDFNAALDASLDAFAEVRSSDEPSPSSDSRRAKVLLVVSDGENHIGDLSTLKQKARSNNITLFAAGVGTEEGGQIPVYRDGREVGVKRNDGRIVRTRLDEESLQSFAENGAYFRIGPTYSALSELPQALNQLDASVLGEEEFEEYAEMYQWPLALALLLLLGEAFIPVRTREQAVEGAAGSEREE